MTPEEPHRPYQPDRDPGPLLDVTYNPTGEPDPDLYPFPDDTDFSSVADRGLYDNDELDDDV
jgi:hypothetical protein